MPEPLDILGVGAVTPVGLDAPQSCAALRAKIKRYTALENPVLPDREPRVGARVSAAPGLRRSEDEWLLNLSARALRECTARPKFEAESTALVLMIPEAHRAHTLCAREDADILQALRERLGLDFSPASRVLRHGAGSLAPALFVARELITSRAAKRCIIGGADSFLRRFDLERLAAVRRLHVPEVPQGVVPGEGAGFVLLGPQVRARPKPGDKRRPRRRVAVLGAGVGFEREIVLEGGSAVGEGMVRAVDAALLDAGIAEAEVDFVAGNFNGERYQAWEQTHAHARAYRTRREMLPMLWPATSFGETGVAGGVLALIAAATAIDLGYAPGKCAAVEARSEDELRSAVLLR
ncbi:hypothetical protein G6O69_33240 [Pseudenhygromyxa sp. WMMC2535]|uniref:hypothetical protein n=1 Tax=Pseudenhygromyxa sp. WMMC2535 TaxID=2712867 RepID=UPI0015561D32|nr:hypothetical protein [Pseudenhygromyxa sp. WMMC2535]NVB42734.1 hypothetical protein [Pseudenhygromyxa sp. WMMC2535]